MTQVFGSACSVAYSRNPTKLWKPFASLVLSASYEATLLAAQLEALENPGRANARVVYLTAIGGGVFGNPLTWIADAITNALRAADASGGPPLDVRLVTYAAPIPRPFADIAAARKAAPAPRKRGRDAAATPPSPPPPPPPPPGA